MTAPREPHAEHGRPLRRTPFRALLATAVAFVLVSCGSAVALHPGGQVGPTLLRTDLGLSSEVPGEVASGTRGDAAAQGELPDGVTVFDDDYPAVGNLDSDLLVALRVAALDAREEGVTLVVASGWRAPEYQQRLLDAAIATYGSRQRAARWVASPETSPHVSGDAVDVGPARARAWLSGRGAAYGLCQIYRNEPWHYELRPRDVRNGCPRMYADPSRDPRLRR